MSSSDIIPQAMDGPRGIGGWLILPIIGLGLTILVTGYNLLTGVSSYTGEVFELLKSRFPDVLTLMVISTVFGVVCIGLAVWCLKLIFAEDHRTPTMMTTFYIVVAVMTLFETYALSVMADRFLQPSMAEGAMCQLVQGILPLAIWIPYFRVSKRVKNTFIR